MTYRAPVADIAFTLTHGAGLAPLLAQGGAQAPGGLSQAQLNARAKAQGVSEIAFDSVPDFLKLPAGMYTLWTIPHTNGVELIVNKQTGQWGTGYNPKFDLGKAPMIVDTTAAPVEKFAISIVPVIANQGNLVMEWGPFRWIAPIAVQ